MYDRLTLEELMSLTTGHSHGRVSILMPTFMAGPDTRQNAIRWKNQLRQAEAMTEEPAVRPEALAQGWEAEGDYEFWQHQGRGLAAYYEGDREKLIRLPLPVEERVVTGDRFYVKPLLGQFFENGPFYLLALSQNDVRLFSGHRFDLEELKVADMPGSIDDALWADQPEASLQFRTAGQRGSGRGTAMFHGSSDIDDRHKTDLKRYFDIVDHALAAFLNGEKAPLVIASVDYLRPIYRDANSYPNLLEEGVSGNPDEMTEKDLGEKAWEVVEPYYRGRLDEASERFGNSISSGLAVSDLEQILLAAHEGRVDTLWVSRDEVLWGRTDDEGHLKGVHDEQQPGDECLLDAAAAKALAASGRVFAVEPEVIPGGTKMAAILRY